MTSGSGSKDVERWMSCQSCTSTSLSLRQTHTCTHTQAQAHARTHTHTHSTAPTKAEAVGRERSLSAEGYCGVAEPPFAPLCAWASPIFLRVPWIIIADVGTVAVGHGVSAEGCPRLSGCSEVAPGGGDCVLSRHGVHVWTATWPPAHRAGKASRCPSFRC